MNIILDTPVKAKLYRSIKDLGTSLGERIVAATHMRGKKPSTVKWYPSHLLNESSEAMHADWQFKGHVLVKELQQATSYDIPVPVDGDWDQIVTYAPSVLYPIPSGQ